MGDTPIMIAEDRENGLSCSDKQNKNKASSIGVHILVIFISFILVTKTELKKCLMPDSSQVPERKQTNNCHSLFTGHSIQASYSLHSNTYDKCNYIPYVFLI